MQDFDPNGAAAENSGIFGLPYEISESKALILPAPWEATASYGSGCLLGPKAIFDASMYVELYDKELGAFYEKGIAMTEEPQALPLLHKKARRLAKPIIKKAGIIGDDLQLNRKLQAVNTLCEEANTALRSEVRKWIDEGRFLGILGGDHSVALPSIQEHLVKYPDMGILQIDAHCDLRDAFEGFKHSHASIMHNVLEETNIKKVVQVGVRGLCKAEYDYIQNSKNRIVTFFDTDISQNKSEGITWDKITEEVVNNLPQEVYISFDIDGLDPKLCPGTGTPIPGGLDYQEARSLLKKVVTSGRKVVGFDLVEVSPQKNTDWDAIVAAHLLYQLIGWSLLSQRN